MGVGVEWSECRSGVGIGVGRSRVGVGVEWGGNGGPSGVYYESEWSGDCSANIGNIAVGMIVGE